MAAEADIDLYDAIEEDYTHEQEDNLLNGTTETDAANDLYDDVLTSTTKAENEEPSEEKLETTPTTEGTATDTTTVGSSGDANKFVKRWSVYISNLTWWTTDIDLTQACNALGVNDVLDIKFYENRANGQSKGFATVSVKSPESMNKLMEKIKSVQIHSQTPNVHYCNRQNLLMLDAATGGNRYEQEQERQAQYQQQNGMRFGPPRVPRPPFQPGQPGMAPRPPMGVGPRVMPARPGMVGAPMGQQMMPGRPPFQQTPMQPMQPMQQRPGMPGMGPPGVNPAGVQGPPQRNMQPGMPMQGGMMPQQQMQGFPQQGPNNIPGMQPPGMDQSGMMPNQNPPTSGAPVPHVNPAFFPSGPNPPSGPGAPVMLDQFGRPIDNQMGQQQPPPAVVPMDNGSGGAPSVSDDEFQEILTRNKSVSSSAISRAVQDASQGDFASAIETLVTAISLIKQSKIANDDRCKILVASLQDTKQGIEDKSYGGGRDRRRDRSRSRDRDRRRDRSRSRDRDRREYRERSRERERPMERERSGGLGGGYYQERSRERDRYY